MERACGVLFVAFVLGAVFKAGQEWEAAKADARERARLEKEDLNHALRHIAGHVGDHEKRLAAVEQVAHGHMDVDTSVKRTAPDASTVTA